MSWLALGSVAAVTALVCLVLFVSENSQRSADEVLAVLDFRPKRLGEISVRLPHLALAEIACGLQLLEYEGVAERRVDGRCVSWCRVKGGSRRRARLAERGLVGAAV